MNFILRMYLSGPSKLVVLSILTNQRRRMFGATCHSPSHQLLNFSLSKSVFSVRHQLQLSTTPLFDPSQNRDSLKKGLEVIDTLFDSLLNSTGDTCSHWSSDRVDPLNLPRSLTTSSLGAHKQVEVRSVLKQPKQLFSKIISKLLEMKTQLQSSRCPSFV